MKQTLLVSLISASLSFLAVSAASAAATVGQPAPARIRRDGAGLTPSMLDRIIAALNHRWIRTIRAK